MTHPSTSIQKNAHQKQKRIHSKEYREKDRLRKKAKRQARTPEEKKLESQKRSEARKAKKAALTEEKWQEVLEQNAAEKRAYQSIMTIEQKQQQAQKKSQKRHAEKLAIDKQRAENRAIFQMKEFKNHPDSFHAFEDHPETSVLLYHLNSGHEKFRDVDYLTKDDAANKQPNQPNSPHMQALLNEITTETLTVEENEKLLQKYLLSQGRSACGLVNTTKSETRKNANTFLQGLPPSIDAHHLVCGAYGIKCIHGQYD